MNSQHAKNLTTRVNKISSTLTLNPVEQSLRSNEQLLSHRHSYRKYKLSHSQIDKLERLSKEGIQKWQPSKQNTQRLTERIRVPTSESVEKDVDQRQQRKRPYNILNQTSNYSVKRDKILQLSTDLLLKIEIIEFDLALNRSFYPKQLKVSSQQDKRINMSVMCFQVHDQHSNSHFRSEFSYKTLNNEVRFCFDSIEELYEYVISQGQNQKVYFDMESLQLAITVQIKKKCAKQQQNVTQKQGFTEKQVRIPLLPFAVVEIEEEHNENHKAKESQQQRQEHKDMLQTIDELRRQIQSQTSLVHALRQQNERLKLKLAQSQQLIVIQKAEKDILLESVEKMSKASRANDHKQYFFQFVPDPKSKNYANFLVKNNTLKKVKNDLKWDQISSQAPLPKSNRHYFTFLINTFTPDYMFGIVTLKGKDTANAFLGLETISLYLAKNNTFIYEQGRHYKINTQVKMGDLVIVIVDRDKATIQWLKKRDTSCKQLKAEENFPRKQRKSSQTITTLQVPAIKLSSPGQTPQFGDEIEYIHSTKIPQDMVSRQLFAYLQIYNINEPIKLNERK